MILRTRCSARTYENIPSIRSSPPRIPRSLVECTAENHSSPRLATGFFSSLPNLGTRFVRGGVNVLANTKLRNIPRRQTRRGKPSILTLNQVVGSNPTSITKLIRVYRTFDQTN
jgi:hypothetical protein